MNGHVIESVPATVRPERPPPPTVADLRAACARPWDHRLLTRLDLPAGPTFDTRECRPFEIGVAIDVETTGLEDDAKVIELGLRRFRFDDRGVITKIGRPYSWFQDPGFPLPPGIVEKTGITDADVRGQAIDVEAASWLINCTSFVCAHNARFDRPRVERLLPSTVGQRWACSMTEIPWDSFGFDGRRLGDLLYGTGRFHEAHRAVSDVDAVIALLRERPDGVCTALAIMLENARRPGWLIVARGAAFDLKELLRARGYRWDGCERAWVLECGDDRKDGECRWLAANVYGTRQAKAAGPDVFRIDWTVRHGR